MPSALSAVAKIANPRPDAGKLGAPEAAGDPFAALLSGCTDGDAGTAASAGGQSPSAATPSVGAAAGNTDVAGALTPAPVPATPSPNAATVAPPVAADGMTTETIAKADKSDVAQKADGAPDDKATGVDGAAKPDAAVPTALVVMGLAPVPAPAGASADDGNAAAPTVPAAAVADGSKPVAESALGSGPQPEVTARPEASAKSDAADKTQPSAGIATARGSVSDSAQTDAHAAVVLNTATTEQDAPPALAGALKAVVGTSETAASLPAAAGLTDKKSVGADHGVENAAASGGADAPADGDDGKASGASAAPSKAPIDVTSARAVAVAATNAAMPRADDRKTNDAALAARSDSAAGSSIIVTPLMPHAAGGAANAQPAVAANAAAAPAIPIAGLAAEITARALEGKRRFEIRLDPPELGRIDVRLDVGKDGQVTSRLVVERSETLDLLRRDAPNLERALESAGLRTNDSGLQFSLRDQSPNGYRPRLDDMPRPNLLIVPDNDVAVREAVRRGYGALRGFGAGIDIQV
ncbi:MAG: flagellar hook-length control protein FliK [Variibacter sp.]